MRVFGYDPGGKGAHGVACLDLAPGAALSEAAVESATLKDADAVLDWFHARPGAVGIGIDSLMMWTTGDRACDRQLRGRYGLHPGSVQSMGSLRGAMLGNGVIVGARLDLPLYEANPKAAVMAGVFGPEARLWAGLADHARDAVVAACCVALAHLGHWTHDLFAGEPAPFWPTGRVATYPWPEALT